MKTQNHHLVPLWIAAIASMFWLCSAHSSEIRLAWDPSPTVGVTNYMIVAHTNLSATTNYSGATVRVNVGTNLTCRIYDLTIGRWYIFAVAVQDGLCSDPSNVLQVEAPIPPSNIRTLTVQYGATLDSMTNNVFFKLKVP